MFKNLKSKVQDKKLNIIEKRVRRDVEANADGLLEIVKEVVEKIMREKIENGEFDDTIASTIMKELKNGTNKVDN